MKLHDLSYKELFWNLGFKIGSFEEKPWGWSDFSSCLWRTKLPKHKLFVFNWLVENVEAPSGIYRSKNLGLKHKLL